MADQPHDAAPSAYGLARRGGPSWTWTWDFVDLSPLPDQSVRVWRVIRMCLNDSKDAADDDRLVTLTDEEIGVLADNNGTPRSRWAVAKAMKPLFEMGLLEEAATERRSVRVPGHAKPQVRTIRHLRVHDEPPEGWAKYAGPVNPFEKLRAYREARDTDAAESVISPVRSDGADSHRQNEQGSSAKPRKPKPRAKTKPSPAKTDVSAGHSDGAKTLGTGSENAPNRERKRPAYQPRGSKQAAEPTNQQTEQAPAAGEPTTPGNDGGLDTSQRDKNTVGERLLRSLRMPDGSAVTAAGVRTWTPFVDGLLADHDEERVKTHLTEGGQGVGFVIHKLKMLKSGDERIAVPEQDAGQPGKPPKCTGPGACDEQRMRQTVEGTSYRCPICHPRAVRSPRDGDVIEPPATDQGERRGGVGTIGTLEELLAG